MSKDLGEIYKCAKPNIDFYTNSICYFFSVRIVHLLKPTRVTPDQLTVLSLLMVIAGSAMIIDSADYPVLVAAGLLFQLAYILDCADGQLARYKKVFSFYGWRLDLYSDRIKEVIILIALGFAATHSGSALYYWVLVAAAIGILNFRKYIDLQEMIKGAEFMGEVAAPIPFSQETIHKCIRLIQRLETAKSRYNLGFMNIGEFYLLLFCGLVLGMAGPLLWVYVVYGLAVAVYQVCRHMIYAAERGVISRRLRTDEPEVIIFGLGSLGRKLLYHLIDNQVRVTALADNDPNKWGSQLAGCEVINPTELPGKYPQAVVLIASYWGGAIEKQLLDMGITRDNIFHIN